MTKTFNTARTLAPSRRRLLVAGLLSGVLALASALPAGAAAPGGATVGGKCTVTAGANKGKSGTYTRDEYGNLWCEGRWGGTQCATRCKNGLLAKL